MSTALLASYVIGVIMGAICLIMILKQPEVRYKTAIAMANVCCIISLLGKIFGFLSTEVNESILACKLAYIGKCYATAFVVLTIVKFYNIKMKKWILYAIFFVNSVAFVLIMTFEHHKLYYISFEPVVENGIEYNKIHGAPFYYFYMAFTVFTFLFSVVLCLSRLRKKNQEASFYDPKLSIILSCIGLIPFIGLMIYLLGWTNGLDTTQLGIMLAAIVEFIAIYHFDMLKVVNLAKEQVVEESSEGVLIVDNHYHIIYKNTTCKQFPEFTKDTITQIINENEDTLSVDGKNYKCYVTELKIKNLLQGYMLEFSDVTDLIRNANEIMSLKEAADTVAKQKADLLAIMSHEIRTPLNGVLGLAEIAAGEDSMVVKDRYISMIAKSGRDLMTLINELLDYSKLESKKMELVEGIYSMQDLFEELSIIEASKIKEKNLEFHMELPEKLEDKYIGDDLRLKQILLNLVNNAIKYTNEGSVDVKVEITAADEEETEFLFSVSDTGIGIKDEDKGKIFESYHRANSPETRKEEGTGLGLVITKELVELMGGTITVESAYGIGSVFRVKLRQKNVIKKDTAASENEIPKIKASFKAPEAKVLVVDDNEVNLIVVEGILKAYDIECERALSGKEALEILEDTSFDLIFMDQMMPEMSGRETVRTYRATEDDSSHTPVIAMTAEEIESEEKYTESGFDAILKKPVQTKSMDALLKQWIPESKQQN
ncbi:MAG: response regulator [Lachnospiraceae bacterium]|nr:response regulator [Lachnospiraceae bacterium]